MRGNMQNVELPNFDEFLQTMQYKWTFFEIKVINIQGINKIKFIFHIMPYPFIRIYHFTKSDYEGIMSEQADKIMEAIVSAMTSDKKALDEYHEKAKAYHERELERLKGNNKKGGEDK